MVLMACVDGTLVAVLERDGKQVWSCSLPGQVFADLNCYSPRGGGDVVTLVATHAGALDCVRCVNGTLAWSLDLQAGPQSCAPAVLQPLLPAEERWGMLQPREEHITLQLPMSRRDRCDLP